MSAGSALHLRRVWAPATDEASSAGAANSLLAEGTIEDERLLGEGVGVRRPRACRLALAPRFVDDAQVVENNEEDVL